MTRIKLGKTRAMIQYFAVTFRGLERVAAGEILRIRGTRIHATPYRRVEFASSSTNEVLKLRTVDDVFVAVASWSGIGHTRAALQDIEQLAAGTDLRKAVDVCGQLRSLPPTLSASITVNFVGRRNYTTDEIKEAAATGFRRNHAWRFLVPDSEANLNVRLFIEHDAAAVGVRLGQIPLRVRSYLTERIAAALKPPVAAAMVLLSNTGKTDELLDPCCGSGLILAEAAYRGCRIRGGDISPAAVRLAQETISRAGYEGNVETWDARDLPLPTNSVDSVVSNLPWGRQVDLTGTIDDVLSEIARVVRPTGKVVLLTETPEAIAIPGLERTDLLEISLAGRRPTIVVYGQPNEEAKPPNQPPQ